MSTIDLSQLSEKQLLAALKNKKASKEADRQAYKELVDETVPVVMGGLIGVSSQLKSAKVQTFSAFKKLLELKFSIYGIKEEQQTHTFTTTDGQSVTIGYNVNDNWDDTVNSGLAKINQYIKSLADKDANKDVISIINQLLKKDAKGNLKNSRVLELINLADDINNELFADGVNIIRKSYTPTRSSFFIKAHYTNNLGQKIEVKLGISSVDFPETFDLSFLLPKKTVEL